MSKKSGPLPSWCKEAKCAMIKKDISLDDLCAETGKSKTWLSSILNGRSYSPDTVKEVSDILGIRDSGNFLGLK